MGSPQSPNATQYAELEKASELGMSLVEAASTRRGIPTYELTLPRQGVLLLMIHNARLVK